MKRWKRVITVLLVSVLTLQAAACTPTKTAPSTAQTESAAPHEHTQPSTTPDGAAIESIDGAADKLNMVVTEDPSLMVCIYTVNADKNGLKQNMDAVPGEELDPQVLLDMMAEYGVVEKGLQITDFKNEDGKITAEISALAGADDELVISAIVNTFTMNFEAESMTLTADGKTICQDAVFIKDFKKIK